MAPDVPTFVVAGAARCGTTGLIEGLRQHPDVFVTTPKEPHYLALHGRTPDFTGPGDEAFNRGVISDLDTYRALFPHQPPLAVGEGSVSTFYYAARALPELIRLNPEARVVVLLREPVARAWSSHQYLRAQGREPEPDLRRAIDDEPRRRRAGWHHLWHYTQMSRYADSLRICRDVLPAGQLGVWFHDDLERDYAGTLAAIQSFIGLEPHPADAPQVNGSGTPRSAHLHRALWWAHRHTVVREVGRRATTWRFREAVRRRLVRRTTVPDADAQVLAPLFADDLAQLRDLLPAEAHLPGWLQTPRTEPAS